MSNFNFSDCKKAVNQATFRPTAERKAAAMKLLQEALDFIGNLDEVKEAKKATKKRRRKTTKKANSQQRVADKQEKAFHGKADTPVKPSSKARTASVEAAREAAKAVSEHTGASARAERKAEMKAEADRVSSLEEKVEMLTQLLALQMQGEQAPTIETISFDELPFQI